MKNKLFLCFRPVVIETDDTKPRHRAHPYDDRASAYIAVAKIRNRKISTIKSLENDDPGITVRRRRKSDSCRSFSRSLKSILSEASLTERESDRNVPQLAFRSWSDGSRKIDAFPNDMKQSGTSSLISSSSLPNNNSLSASISMSNSFNRKKQSISNTIVRDRWSSCSNAGLCLMLITLCITIIWGRVYAILFTSVWLYFIPRRRDSDRRFENTAEMAETEAASEYKNRSVIMEGLLERNHYYREGIKLLT